jgi:nitrogen regulatory protein PII
MKTQEMNKLKQVLKPLVMECIKEAIFEEGVLSTLVAEIVTGMGQPIVEQRKQQEFVPPKRDTEAVSKRLQESKNKMLDAIGKDAYGGVDIFEGTEPLSSAGNTSPSHSPLANIDPNDKGVSIDGLVGAFGAKWNALK